MKKLYSFFLASCCSMMGTQQSFAQVNLPYTLNFTSHDATAWADGIASDGDGGTSNINGLDIEIFAASSGFTLLPGATMTWHDNDYFASNDGAYTGITPGPDVPVTNDGVPAMVIRSSNPAINFSLVSLKMYDWGDITTLSIEAFNNGVSLGLVQVNLNATDWTPELVSQSDILTPSIFQSVDEVRFYPDGTAATWLSMNEISLAEPSGTLPVQWISFNGSVTAGNDVLLEWQTAREENNAGFVVEHSTDGRQFSPQAEVAATDNSLAINHYQKIISGLPAGQHYFRIRQVDADGRFSFSRTITLTTGMTSRMSVYPNPLQSSATLRAGGSVLEQVSVYSVGGRLLERFQPRATQVLLNLDKHPNGIYFIEIVTAEGKHRQRVLKK